MTACRQRNGGLDTASSFATIEKMKFRSIHSIGIFALFFGIFFGGEAEGKGAVYSRVDRTAFPQSSDQGPAPMRVARRPKLARIPNLDVYHAPDLSYNLYLFEKRWYFYHNGKWYQGQTHEGPWRYLSYSNVPDKLKKIPAEFIKKNEPPPPVKKKLPPPPKKKSSQKKTPSKK